MRFLTAAWLTGLAGFATLGTAGCGSCGTPSGGAEAGAVAPVEPPVPAPEGLLAEVWLRGPDATWGKIQRGVSGAVALLPPTVSELACAFAGLDSAAARLVDGKGTSYAVLGEGAEGLAWVVALPVPDAALASSTLLDGGDAAGRYSARDVGGMRALASPEHPSTPGEARPALNVTVALARGAARAGWLVLASSEDALARLGPYAVRTMPTKAAPPEPGAIVADVPSAALAGSLSRWLGARWGETRAWLGARDDEQRAKHGGRPPDFGDPRPIVDALDGAITRRIALLAGAHGAHLVVDAGEDEVHGELSMASDADASGATPGDTRPLAATPADAVVALLLREDTATRAEDAATAETVLDKALGDRVRADDTLALHTAITDWARARGDWWTGALAWGASDASRGIWLRTPADSADASTRAVRELVELSHRRGFHDLLAGLHLSPGAVRSADAPPLGKVSLAPFTEEGGKGKPEAAGLGIAWGVHDGELLLAAGMAAPQLLSAGAAPPRRVGDDPRTARALAALGRDASLVLVAQPLRFVPARADAEASAPAVFGWGRKGGGAWARLELADVLLRELLRLKAGL